MLDLLLGHLDEAFDHEAWHGGTLWGAVREEHEKLRLLRVMEESAAHGGR